MSTFISATATIIKATGVGAVSGGPIAVPGLLPGDVVVKVLPDGFSPQLEDVISVADELQQYSALDWSSLTFTFYLLRGV